MRQTAWRFALGLLAAWLATTAGAQALEGVLMPGKVIAGHAKYEQECDKCHLKFKKEAQDSLCLDCHKETAQDVRAKTGYHGRIKIEACRICHTDHKGRDVNIAPFDQKTFDHAKTDYGLAGAHVKVECKKCHVPEKKYREAPGGCNDCHKKDDKHKGNLGPKCAECHTDKNWKEARFDHSKTKFDLTFKHIDVKCKDCHANDVYKNTPVTCVGCHRKDDKQHRGRLGDKCEPCHNAKDWKDTASFSHDRDTKYPLRGKHRTIKCEACHTVAAAVLPKVATDCNGCHKNDDKHKGTLGLLCGDCHTERNWKEAKYDHDLSVFKLRGQHRDVECKECHRDPKSYKGTPLNCYGCHKKDGPHKDRYGDKCESCHTDKSWRDMTFRHAADTKYPLTGRHADVKCDSCHPGHVYKDKLKTDCYSCHKKDDPHKDKDPQGQKCDKCHETADWWKTSTFDHNKSHFPLLGRHAIAKCEKCHLTPVWKDAKRDCFACHEKEDAHKRKLGTDCAPCHNARDWKIWDYDHNRKTKFVIDGAHTKVACITCHKTAAPADGKIPALGITCVACHRSDDIHSGDYGPQCERCHETRSWRDIKPLGRKRSGLPFYQVVAAGFMERP